MSFLAVVSVALVSAIVLIDYSRRVESWFISKPSCKLMYRNFNSIKDICMVFWKLKCYNGVVICRPMQSYNKIFCISWLWTSCVKRSEDGLEK